jgi:hypothetical protein
VICPECKTKSFNRNVTTACPKCRYQLVFPPRDASQINDYFFIKKLKYISSDNTYYFTVKQLYYYLLNTKSFKIANYFFFASFICVFFSIPLLLTKTIFGVFLVSIAIIISIIGYSAYTSWKFPYDINKFNEIVIKRWELYKGNITNLLKEEDLRFNTTKFNDIENYSFDALLVTGDNETANFLIKNDFHFKNKTAIVSINKYPNHLFPYVIEQVVKNPNIPIFLIHNADILSVENKDKVQKNWFKNTTVQIFDLGLHPYHVLKRKKLVSLKRNNITLPDINLSNYSPKEQNWLKSGYYTELSVVPPIKLINLLEYAINLHKEKGALELEKVMASLFIVGLGLKLPKFNNSSGSNGGGFEIDFGDDFG